MILRSTPGGCTLKRFTVLHPKPAHLREIYSAFGLAITVQSGVRGGFVLVLDTPRGEVCLLG